MSSILPDYVIINSSGWSYQLDPVAFITEMDMGLSRRRAKNTRPLLFINCEFLIKSTVDMISFRLFWENDLNNGLDIFSMINPITKNQDLVRFSDPALTWTSLSKDVWSSRVQLELLL